MTATGNKKQNNSYSLDYNRMPEAKTKWKAFQDYIHDPAEGTYCGHTGKKWAITGAFYTCFFAVLALLFAICMKGLLATINPEKPRWTLDESLIGSNPGLGFRPVSDNTAEKALIWYSSSDPASVQKWTKLLNTFLKEYTNSTFLPNGGRNQQICNYNTPVKPGNVCEVDVNNWGPCSPNEQYGFNNSAPCIFIKLNRIYDWEPEFYNDTNNLPKEMPDSLVQHIKSINSSWLNTVWVSCVGENPHDTETIGELNYYPKSQGFPGYYYPYKNIPGYLSPVVAVHFLRPASYGRSNHKSAKIKNEENYISEFGLCGTTVKMDAPEHLERYRGCINSTSWSNNFQFMEICRTSGKRLNRSSTKTI